MSKKSLHIVRREDGGWSVKATGSSRDRSRHATQADAIRAARTVAQNQGSEVVIHGRDGHIISRDSYGSDVAPPRGKVKRTKPAGSNPAKRSLPQIKKAIASLRPEEQTAIRQWMDSKKQRNENQASLRWPDFRARQKAIFGNRILPDSQTDLDEARADRF